MRELYSEIEPYRTQRLAVDDLHELHIEECGNPDGLPVIFLHGGPGAGVSPYHRRFFDPARYRIVLFDQRGAGKSTPHAELRDNTTWHLVADIETIREHFGIDRWVVFGGSWGSTLALAYAQTHPERVLGLVLRGIFLGRPHELRWFNELDGGARWIFPERWERYLEAGNFDEPRVAISVARSEAHYFRQEVFLEPDQLLRDVGRIRHIPATIVHGRYDIICPVKSAYDLSQAWPEAELRIVLAGHSAADPAIVDALVSATDALADRFG
jgi:proline iminopeptidase